MLGVCRGMQVMAVHAGGDLDQHVPDLVEHEQHNPALTSTANPVSMSPGTRLAVSSATGPVHCHHHQSVRDHPGFKPVAWADDGLLEAIEDPATDCGGRPMASGGGPRPRPVPRPRRRRLGRLTMIDERLGT